MSEIEIVIETKIYLIRGVKVMLDSDLAALYQVPVKRLNEQVRRNMERFPGDCMFQLLETEWEILRSQFATLRSRQWGDHRKYLPIAFTELGIAMLSSVLHSSRAIQVNLAIMRTFVRLRNFLLSHKDLSLELRRLEQKYDGQFAEVFDALREVVEEKSSPRKQIKGLSPD